MRNFQGHIPLVSTTNLVPNRRISCRFVSLTAGPIYENLAATHHSFCEMASLCLPMVHQAHQSLVRDGTRCPKSARNKLAEVPSHNVDWPRCIRTLCPSGEIYSKDLRSQFGEYGHYEPFSSRASYSVQTSAMPNTQDRILCRNIGLIDRSIVASCRSSTPCDTMSKVHGPSVIDAFIRLTHVQLTIHTPSRYIH
jgi:hypothetical protein